MTGADAPGSGPSVEQRTRALESLLLEKGLITVDALDRIARTYQDDIGPMRGARVVARAWVDERYRERLLRDGAQAVAELGYTGIGAGQLVAVANTPTVHNVVVCTLCSCYPWAVLGLPPSWYKDPAYRARAVREPRRLLREMGLELEEHVEIKVWDSSADNRYLVVPERPAGTDGLAEDDLVALVTRDSMIGVARARTPAEGRDHDR